MRETNKRVEWIDIIKFACIMFVMISHLEANTKPLYAFYSPFFLTAFFFSSGYVYRHKNNFKDFICKKTYQLFLPWLVFSVLNILLSQIVSFNEHKNLWYELKWNFLQIRGLGDGVWFVAALFVAFIPFYFFIKWYESETKLTNKQKTILALFISFALSFVSVIYTKLLPSGTFSWKTAALPWHLEYIFQAMFYMVLGYVFKNRFEAFFDKYVKKWYFFGNIVLYLVVVYVPYALHWKMPMLLDVFHTYFSEILGLIFIISIAKRIPSNRYINYVGQNTLIYFALHGKIYSLIQTMLHRYASGLYSVILNNVFVSSIFAIVFAVGLSLILIIPAHIINRWFPFIAGRKMKKQQ